MTNETFWNLYENNTIRVKSILLHKENRDIEVSAFEFGNKFYLRICTMYQNYVLDRRAECGKSYKMSGQRNAIIKTFDNKASANRYYMIIKTNV